MTQLSLEIALLGHVTERGDHAVDGVTTEQVGDRGFHPATVTIDTNQARLELDHPTVAEPNRLAQLRCGGVTVVARHEIDHRPAGPIARTVPERARQPWARVPDHPVGVHEQDHVTGVLDHRGEPILAPALGQTLHRGDQAPHPGECEHDDDDRTDRGKRPRRGRTEAGDQQAEQHRQGRERCNAQPDDASEAEHRSDLDGPVHLRHRRIECGGADEQ